MTHLRRELSGGGQESTMQDRLVDAEDRDGIRILRLSRPPVNALDLELAGATQKAVEDARLDAGCTGLVLTGLPGVFSAGIDTRRIPAYDTEQRAAMLRTINRTVLALYGFPKPAVAAVSGHTLGGAFVLMLACDVRLAARGAFRLGLTEAEAGIPYPAGPLAVVRAELTPVQRRTLALGSLTAAPESDLFEGIIDCVVEPAELVEAACEQAKGVHSIPVFARDKPQHRSSAWAEL